MLYDGLTTSFPEDSIGSDDDEEDNSSGGSKYDIDRAGSVRHGPVAKRWKLEGIDTGGIGRRWEYPPKK